MPDELLPRSITILKVPANVGEQWDVISGIGRHKGSRALGRIRKRTMQLEMSDEVYRSGKVGRTYELQTQQVSHVPTVIISEAAGTHAIEGHANIQGVRPALDAAYAKQRATATADANAERYYTEVDQTGVQRQDALNATINVTLVEKHKKLAKEEFLGRKEDLEGELFMMFKKKDHWVIKDVQVPFTWPGKPEVDPSTTPASNQSILAALLQCIALRLRQRALGLSHSHATELLSEIAERVKSGPYRGEWMLKAIYRVADSVNGAEGSK